MLLAVLVLISAFLLNLFLPWWSIAIPGLIFGYVVKEKPISSFLWGFLALFILWGGQSLYIHFANDEIMATRIAEMLGVGSPLIVVLMTAVLGGVVSGLSATTGALINQSNQEK